MKVRLIVYTTLAIILVLFGVYGREYWFPVYKKTVGKKTVADVVETCGQKSRSRLMPLFDKAGISYPPKKITFLAIKDSKTLELWVSNKSQWHQLSIYDIKASSGSSGPKLMEGDGQVPEGIYKIIGMNPNSSYHLSMKLNYPNDFDLKWAKIEKRHQPGSNIFIHGKSVSIGCLAMGDEAIEELFVLARDVGISNIAVILAPTDPRINELEYPEDAQPWVEELYENIEAGFRPFNHKDESLL